MLEACDAVVILVLYVGCGFTMFLLYFRNTYVMNVGDVLCTVR